MSGPSLHVPPASNACTYNTNSSNVKLNIHPLKMYFNSLTKCLLIQHTWAIRAATSSASSLLTGKWPWWTSSFTWYANRRRSLSVSPFACALKQSLENTYKWKAIVITTFQWMNTQYYSWPNMERRKEYLWCCTCSCMLNAQCASPHTFLVAVLSKPVPIWKSRHKSRKEIQSLF